MGVEVMLLVSRQGKVRLTKFYKAYEKKEKTRIVREISSMVLSRPNKLCNFLAWRNGTIVYKRYAVSYMKKILLNHGKMNDDKPCYMRGNTSLHASLQNDLSSIFMQTN